ncbi:MAG: hypothetical protein LCH76_12680 [Actinobacteria bacterium]|nr:hypothetical protein [Actinomycetota bacterium]
MELRRRVRSDNPWFPGQSGSLRFESGWELQGQGIWDVDSPDAPEAVDMVRLSMDVPGTLSLTFRIDYEALRRIEFPGLVYVEITGDMAPQDESGWEVMGTQMIAAPLPRQDGRVVYLLDVPNTLICFASLVGRQVG